MSEIWFRDPTPEELAELERLYARIPRTLCVGKCADSCTTFDMTTIERVRLLARGYNVPPRRTVADVEREGRETGRVTACPALSALGACRVYDARPFICRAWPVDVPGMRCSHGCKPERPISWTELLDIQEAIMALSRRAALREPFYVERGE